MLPTWSAFVTHNHPLHSRDVSHMSRFPLYCVDVPDKLYRDRQCPGSADTVRAKWSCLDACAEQCVAADSCNNAQESEAVIKAFKEHERRSGLKEGFAHTPADALAFKYYRDVSFAYATTFWWMRFSEKFNL